MINRPGRPPKLPTGETSTITLRLRAETKTKLIEDSEALGLSMTELLDALITKGI